MCVYSTPMLPTMLLGDAVMRSVCDATQYAALAMVPCVTASIGTPAALACWIACVIGSTADTCPPGLSTSRMMLVTAGSSAAPRIMLATCRLSVMPLIRSMLPAAPSMGPCRGTTATAPPVCLPVGPRAPLAAVGRTSTTPSGRCSPITLCDAPYTVARVHASISSCDGPPPSALSCSSCRMASYAFGSIAHGCP